MARSADRARSWPKRSQPIMDAIEEFRAAIRNAGLVPPEVIVADGRLRRFASGGEAGDDAGWYVLHSDGIPAGAFGCWRSDIHEKWRSSVARSLTADEEKAERE